MSNNEANLKLSGVGIHLIDEIDDYLRRRSEAGCTLENIDQFDVKPVTFAYKLGRAAINLGISLGSTPNPQPLQAPLIHPESAPEPRELEA